MLMALKPHAVAGSMTSITHAAAPVVMPTTWHDNLLQFCVSPHKLQLQLVFGSLCIVAPRTVVKPAQIFPGFAD